MVIYREWNDTPTDEHVLGVDPEPAREVAADLTEGRVRPHFFVGRSLSERELGIAQDNRDARARALGRALLHGVVWGLEVSARDAHHLTLGPGVGVLPDGETTRLSNAVSLAVADLAWGGPASEVREASANVPAALRDFPTLQRVVPTTRVGLLALRPAEAQWDPVPRPAPGGAFDPCPDDGAIGVIDARRLDGVIATFVPLAPDLVETFPSSTDPFVLSRWRNRQAWRLFEREGSGASWGDPRALPLALLVVDAGLTVLAIDRACVARRGGGRRATTLPMGLPPAPAASPHAALWHARIDQFGAQLAEVSSHEADLRPRLSGAFDRIPPVARVPSSWLFSWMPTAWTAQRPPTALRDSRFQLPMAWTAEVAPTPLEQLGEVLAESASLAPLVTAEPEFVRVLVPVPGAVYDPALLEHEEVAPSFQQAIDASLARVREHLARRTSVRGRLTALYDGVQGPLAPPGRHFETPDKDPSFTGGEELSGAASSASLDELDYGAPGDPPRPAAIAALLALPEVASLRFERAEIFELLDVPRPTANAAMTASDAIRDRGLDGLLKAIDAAIDAAESQLTLGFTGMRAQVYALHQALTGNAQAARLAVSPVLGEVLPETRTPLDSRSVESVLEAWRVRTVSLEPTPPPSAPRAPEASRAGAGAASPGSLLQPTAREGFAGSLAREPDLSVTLRDNKWNLRAEDIAEFIGPETTTRKGDLLLEIGKSAAVDTRSQVLGNKGATFVGLADLKGLGLGVEHVAIGTYDNVARTLDDIKTNQVTREKIISDTNIPAQTNEAAVFARSVEHVEQVYGVLEGVKGRVRKMRNLRARVVDARKALTASAAKAEARLREIERELLEARHDLTVSRALRSEEEARVQAINTRRDATLREAVPFLVILRPRTLGHGREPPTVALDPTAGGTLPRDLPDPAAAPPELRAYLDLVRDSPAKWFSLPRWIPWLDQHAAAATLARALWLRATRWESNWKAAVQAPSGGGKATLYQRFSRREQIVQRRVVERQGIDADAFARRPLLELRERLGDHATLGDLLDGGTLARTVAPRAAEFFRRFGGLATAFYERCCRVQPSIRLRWALQVGQYDDPIDLRSLAHLERWMDVGRDDTEGDHTGAIDRRALQALVDALYRQVDTRDLEALDLVHDLVQVCILLAAHAPVNDLLAGHVHREVVVRPGVVFPVFVAALQRVTLGMEVHIAAERLVRARIRDIDAELVHLEALDLDGAPALTLPRGAPARFLPTARG